MTYREEQLILKRIEELEKKQEEQDEKIESLETEIMFINNYIGRGE